MTFVSGDIVAAPYSSANGEYLKDEELKTLLYPARVIAVPKGNNSLVIKYLDGIPNRPIVISPISMLPLIRVSPPNGTALCRGFYDQVNNAPPFESALVKLRDSKHSSPSAKPIVINYDYE